MKKFFCIILCFTCFFTACARAQEFKIDIIPGEVNDYSDLVVYPSAYTVLNGKAYYSNYNDNYSALQSDNYYCKVGYFLPAGVYQITNNSNNYKTQVTVYSINITAEETEDGFYTFSIEDENTMATVVGANEQIIMTLPENYFFFIGNEPALDYHSLTFERIG